MILNNTYCVDNVQDLKNFNRAITPTCMTYSNHTARQINPRTYEIPFIGSQATTIQLEMEQKQLQMLESKMDKLYDLSDKNDRIIRLLNQSKSSQLVHQGQLKYIDLIKQTRREYTQIETQIASLGKDKNIQKLDEQIEKARIQRRQLRLDSEQLVGEIATLRENRQRVYDLIDDIKDKIENYAKEQKILSLKHPEKTFTCKYSVLCT